MFCVAGTAELSFFMAEAVDAGVPWTPLQKPEQRLGAKGGLQLGEHLFTLSLSGELTVKDLRLEPDLPDRPKGWRLGLSMKVILTAFRGFLVWHPRQRDSISKFSSCGGSQIVYQKANFQNPAGLGQSSLAGKHHHTQRNVRQVAGCQSEARPALGLPDLLECMTTAARLFVRDSLGCR